MRALVLALALLWPLAAVAVTPAEQLADPVLESRAREISKLLRCPQCQSESIDDSNAEIAQDLRRLVRERLVAGDTDRQVIDYAVARYGEYVLFLPEARGINLVLWGAGPALLLLGLLTAAIAARRRKTVAVAPEALTEEEKRRLEDLTRD